ncbi:hypothetical protein JVT61DRAFT_3328 [Boletus reticuloceps]|uniref:Uncharacterized protein n=1 Tax=Boletus reticuloceps TaxID=495285 RepID=A0A8I3A9W9_9AGAM|nr:hypothetical protein JVT61DRAFT_3328 [Boletus reticuloceps]
MFEEKNVVDEAKYILEKNRFVYDKLDNKDVEKAFLADFMLDLMATIYLPYICGFMHIPELNMQALQYSGMSGTMGMCTAALKRGLSIICNGHTNLASQQAPASLNPGVGGLSESKFTFSEQNWGIAMRGLAAAARCRTNKELVNIMEQVRKVACSMNLPADSTDPEEAHDEYACI